ncbi:MAG: zinc ribbon domain-containing protein [Faecousia sp.]
MLCPNCGTDVSSAGRFCPNCGTPLQESKPTIDTAPQQQYQQPQYPQQQYQPPQYQQQQYQQPLYQQPYPPMQAAAPQMNWYKFLIYFALFASAVVNAINAIRFFTGLVNGSSADAQWLYAIFPSWKTVDIIVGLLLLVLAAFSIFTRFRLSGYYKNGPLCLYLTYGLSALSNIVYLLGVALVISGTGISLTDLDIVPTVTSIVVSIVMIVINVLYFNKRKQLFNQ